MAVDTLRKRASIVAIGFMAAGPSVVADGSFDQGDRQTIGYSYAGIEAAEPSLAGFICIESAYLSVAKAPASLAVAYSSGSIRGC